jgi:hypothetical protein
MSKMWHSIFYGSRDIPPAATRLAAAPSTDENNLCYAVMCRQVSMSQVSVHRAHMPSSLGMIADEARMSISVTCLFLRHYLRYILRSVMAKQLAVTDGFRYNRVRGAGHFITQTSVLYLFRHSSSTHLSTSQLLCYLLNSCRAPAMQQHRVIMKWVVVTGLAKLNSISLRSHAAANHSAHGRLCV